MKQCCKDYLMEQFGDEDVVREIYAEYVNSMQEKIPQIEVALTAANWSGLDALAHAIKGNALATGDSPAADVAIALRGAAKMSDRETARSLFGKLKGLAEEL